MSIPLFLPTDLCVRYPLQEPPQVSIPLFISKVPAGFASPADEYIEKYIDLNELLTPNPIASIFFIATGESMRNANIFHGSVCAVDRSVVPRDKHIVLAVVDGDVTVKRLRLIDGVIELHPENPEFLPMRFLEGQEVRIVGVVRGTVAKFSV